MTKNKSTEFLEYLRLAGISPIDKNAPLGDYQEVEPWFRMDYDFFFNPRRRVCSRLVSEEQKMGNTMSHNVWTEETLNKCIVKEMVYFYGRGRGVTKVYHSVEDPIQYLKSPVPVAICSEWLHGRDFPEDEPQNGVFFRKLPNPRLLEHVNESKRPIATSCLRVDTNPTYLSEFVARASGWLDLVSLYTKGLDKIYNRKN